MKIHPHRLLYESGTPFGSLDMVLEGDGTNGVWVSFNGFGRPEIGFYERKDALADFERLRASKAKNGIDHLPLPSPSETVPPGTVFVGLTETTDNGQSYFGRGFPTYEVPPSVVPLFDEAERIAESVLDHPVRVLRGNGAPASPTFRADEPFGFTITLRSVGTEPVKVDNNLVEGDKDSPKWTGVRLVIEPAGPVGKRSDEPVQAYLSPQNLEVKGAKGDAPRDRWLLLAPGEELRIEARRKFHATPGRYRATAWLAFYARGDLTALAGNLELDLGTFEVVRSAKARSKLP